MQSKSIILIFSAIMLLQTQALPRIRREAGGVAVDNKQAIVTAGDSDSSPSEEPGEARKLLQELMTTTLMDMVDLAKYVTEHGQPLLKNALSQLEPLPEKSPALQANITRISDFLKSNPGNIVAAEGQGRQAMMSLFESTFNFTDIMKNLHDMPADLEETQLLQKAFKDNGIERFEEDLLTELKVATGKFDRKIDMYLNLLNETQKQKESKLIDWHTKFRNEKDEKKKAEHYTYFFDTYKP